jgi:hypothetical protein
VGGGGEMICRVVVFYTVFAYVLRPLVMYLVVYKSPLLVRHTQTLLYTKNSGK